MRRHNALSRSTTCYKGSSQKVNCACAKVGSRALLRRTVKAFSSVNPRVLAPLIEVMELWKAFSYVGVQRADDARISMTWKIRGIGLSLKHATT
eukprot:1179623-Prorocentrum_minimum.AAC.4